MNKTTFTFIAIAILLLASFIPVANNVSAEKANEAKTIEVQVKIYTLQGIKGVRKKLPAYEARKLMHIANEAKDAIATLFSKNTSFMEKVKANAIIDSFLHELKKNELLGGMSIKEVKELITKKYLMKNKNSMEMQKINAIAKFFQQNGWEINAMCIMYGAGGFGYHPWNVIWLSIVLPLWGLCELIVNGSMLMIVDIIFGSLVAIPEIIPHPTTIGFWRFVPYGFYPQHPWIETWGLFGYKKLEGYELVAITLGFTGSVITVPFATIDVGFCPSIAMKRVE
ncbi:MAG: hypothetical protein J7L58_02550 [Thermoplasmata archaeon]|nr:hypothetical protein [Thermoplasmata archaeon]